MLLYGRHTGNAYEVCERMLGAFQMEGKRVGACRALFRQKYSFQVDPLTGNIHKITDYCYNCRVLAGFQKKKQQAISGLNKKEFNAFVHAQVKRVLEGKNKKEDSKISQNDSLVTSIDLSDMEEYGPGKK